MSEGTQRRLTTIVAADIAGFSRLVGIDEEGALAAQRGHRTELIEPLLAEHHGRIANTAEDQRPAPIPYCHAAIHPCL
jgi:class 3 adenylate cyclase